MIDQLSDDSALNYVLERIQPDGTNAERRPLEEQWFGDMAYLYGRPHFVPENGYIRPPQNPKFLKDKYNANLILPKVLRSVAKLQGLNTQLSPLPQSTHRKDLRAAKLAGKVFSHLQDAVGFRRKLYRALMWAAPCGSGFMRVSWDPKTGKARRIYLRPETEDVDLEAMYDANLQADRERAGRFVDRYDGEIRLDVTDPFQTWWDPEARGGGVEDATWMGTVIARTTDSAYDMWGVQAAPEPADLRGVEVYRDILAFIAGDNFRGIGLGNSRNNLTREVEYFEIPRASNGHRGRHIVIVGGKIVVNDVNPFGWLPFVKVDWFPVEGRFMGLSLVNQMRGPQKARNESRAHMVGFMKKSGYAPVILPRGAGVKPVQVAALHGMIWEADLTNGQPYFGQPPQLPPYIMQNVSDPDMEMDKISAQADPTNSKLPGQLRSGVAVAALQADNNAILTPTSEALLASVADLGSKMLEIAGTRYDGPRMLRVVGPDGAVDIQTFLGSDLRGHYRIHVLAQPGALDSREARQSKIYEAVQLGILNMQDPDHQVLALRGLDYNSADDFMSAMLQEEQDEWRQIDRMIEIPDYFPEPAPWNNPQRRAKVLERFLNSPEFEAIDDLAKKKIAVRWQLFSEAIARQLQAQQVMMESAKGSPGETGKASQPAR